MKRSIPLVAGAVLVAAAVAASTSALLVPGAPAARRSTMLLRLPRATAAGQTSVYGHVKSLARSNGRWELRFDPALLLVGAAAEQAAFEDTGSRDVPNDSYTLDESRRLLTYVVSSRARITVLTRSLGTATVGVPEFAKILRGKNPRARPLFGDPRTFGFWIRVGVAYPNAVLSLDQQYHP